MENKKMSFFDSSIPNFSRTTQHCITTFLGRVQTKKGKRKLMIMVYLVPRSWDFLFVQEYPEVASCDSGSHFIVIRINECLATEYKDSDIAKIC